jgi:uncharacterized protein YecE (DUF72 family)
MSSLAKIGTSGFRMSKGAYAERLSTVEVQDTFYKPPKPETLVKWRQELPSDFEFAMKAWQLITHESKSPTYKRAKLKITDQEAEEAGFFKPTDTVRRAWQTTLDCAGALEARTVLFQCPASFTPSPENIDNLKSFMNEAERGGLNFCWEPRGDWPAKTVRDLCESLNLWHAVDPFAVNSVTPERVYFRLHGRRGWRYQYDDSELDELATMLPREKLSYVFFNNIHMIEDAQRFEKIVTDYLAE